MTNKYGMGALKDKEDRRDFLIKDYLVKVSLPEVLDLSGNMLDVRDQGAEGTCVAFASTAVKESEEGNEGYLSPRFMYDRIAQPQGGAYPRDAMEVLLKEGVCSEECQPYTPNVKTPPCADSLDRAKQNKIKAYARLLAIDDFRQCLVQYGCFMASLKVSEGWLTPDNNGVVHNTGNVLGGHAIAFCGYDDKKQLLKFKNSWGKGWGVNGYGYIGYTDAMAVLYDAWRSVDIPETEEEKSKSLLQRLIDWLKRVFHL